jgi:hypothetical protein
MKKGAGNVNDNYETNCVMGGVGLYRTWWYADYVADCGTCQ